MADSERSLLRTPDGEVRLDGLRLTCVCEGGVFESAFRHVAALGVAVMAIVGGLAIAGAVPLPLLIVFPVWLLGGIGAVIFIARRRPQHGTFEIDFDRREVRHARRAGARSYPLDGVVSLEPSIEEVGDEEIPRWLVLRIAGDHPRTLRLARAPLASLHAVLYHFRKHGLASAYPPRP